MSRSRLRSLVLPMVGAVVLLYAGALLGVSLTSDTRVLPVGEELKFCGFYLDCHLGARVTGLEIIPGPGGGLRYRVKVRFASDARQATLEIEEPRAVLIDPATRQRLAPVATPRLLELRAGTTLETDFVFDALTPMVEPRLHLSKGSFFERLTDRILIGDPDSFLHRPVLLAVR